MNKIIPFSKDINFNDVIGEVTSILLDDDLSFTDKYTISGRLTVRGSHKYGDIEEDFSFDIPVLISVDDKYDTEKTTISVDDFYYEIINEKILKVKIDLILDDLYYKDDRDISLEMNDKNNDNLQFNLETEKINLDFDKENINESNINLDITNDKSDNTANVDDLFKSDNLDKNYSVYRVYTVNDGDTLDSILDKYKVSKDELELYNDLTKLEIGTKLIIPSTDE